IVSKPSLRMGYFLQVTRNSLLATILTLTSMTGTASVPDNTRGDFPALQPAGEYAATLRDLLILLKNKHKVNILFEDKLVNHPAAGTRLSGNATLEQNLTRIL